MAILTMVIDHVEGAERPDQFHHELSDILSRLSLAVGQTGVPLPEIATDRRGLKVGVLVWSFDAVRKAG
jgi:hypothetical protein